jgi:hypothetical protein
MKDVMTARRQWNDLSERTRRLLITAAVAEGILRVAALIDIKRRPASQIRGRKWVWAAVVAVVSSARGCAGFVLRLRATAAGLITVQTSRVWT